MTREKSKPLYELFYGKEHPNGQELHIFGEMGMVVGLIRR